MSVDKWASQGDIFRDKESLLKIWIDERRSRDVSACLMWQNLKYFSVLITGIISVDTFFLGFALRPLSDYTFMLSLFSFVFPILVVALSLCARNDLKRRWKRTLESIAYLNKLDDLLGLNKPVTGKINVLKHDSHLFQGYHDSTVKRWKNRKTGKVVKEEEIETEEDYRDWWMYMDNMYTAMRNVYWVFGIIGVALLGLQPFLLIYRLYVFSLTLDQ